MRRRFSSPFVRLGVAAFVGLAMAAIGCSLFVSFDESLIPAEDGGTTEVGEVAETGPPPNDSLPKPDSDAAPTDSHVDGDAPPAETTAETTAETSSDTHPDTSDSAPPTDSGVGVDTTVADSGVDSAVTDVGVDLGVDTTVLDVDAAD